MALVPLALAVHGSSPGDAGLSARGAALCGALFGAVSAAGMYFWLWSLPAFNGLDAIALCAYLALYPAAWCASLVWLRAHDAPWVVSGAASWTLLHVARAHADFLSLPWEPLSHGQTRCAQAASLGGAPLVAFAVCLGNLALAQAWRMRRLRPLVAPSVSLVALHAWGLLRLGRSAGAPADLDVAVIQPGPPAPSPAAQLGHLRALTLEALQSAPSRRPSLVVWPESAVQGLAFDVGLARPESADLASEAGASIPFGSRGLRKVRRASGSERRRR